MEMHASQLHNHEMAQKPQQPARKQYRSTKIREWRKYRGLTIEQLANRIEMSAASLSYLERGKSAYTQGTLEALSEAMGTSPESLLSVDPKKEGEVIDLVRQINERDRPRAIQVLKAFTGTDS